MSNASELGRRSCFVVGVLTIKPADGEIEGPHGRRHVEPRVMQVLLALADAGGSTVTRPDLMTLCRNSRIVGDDALNRVIVAIRKVVREIGSGSLAVITIPKIGYRLTVAMNDDPLTSQRR